MAVRSMASACSRIAQRTSISFIKSAIKSKVAVSPLSRTALPQSTSALRRSFSTRSRIAPELGCVQSMLPLHSAVAAARMTSCLSTTSRSFRAISQGTLHCTSPGP